MQYNLSFFGDFYEPTSKSLLVHNDNKQKVELLVSTNLIY